MSNLHFIPAIKKYGFDKLPNEIWDDNYLEFNGRGRGMKYTTSSHHK